MATSGTYSFAPTVVDTIVEAYERCGIEESNISGQQWASARRAMNYLLITWQNRGIKQWLIEQRSVTLTASDATPTVDARMIDILDMVLRRDGVDTPVHSISRSQYLEIPDKDQEGRPDRYWVDRQQGAVVLTLWPVPENSTDIIVFNQLRRVQDITASNNAAATESPDVHILWMDALAAELAQRLALKFAPERYERLKGEAKDAYQLADSGGRERGSVQFRIA